MRKNEIALAVASDLHLGHRRNPASEIIKNLNLAFPDSAATAELDLIVLAGDVWDDLLTLSNEEMEEIYLWIARLLRLCSKHGIILRVLEGTPSHDWKQSQHFITVEKMLQTGADFQYVQTLSIEYIEPLGINVLYLPDEWNTSAEKTLSEVRGLLKAKGLDKVDFAFMHGQFEYQLPDFVKAQKHSSEAYLDLVSSLIFIGHIHVHSVFERIVAQGSFDRISHGEEAPKGHARARVQANGDYDLQFVENATAKRFMTVDCTGCSLEETLELIDRRVTGLPDDSAVRVLSNSDNPIFVNMEMLIRRYPLYTWSKKPVVEENEILEHFEDDGVVFTPITLTPMNLGDLLIERIAASEPTSEVIESAKDILQEVL